MNIETRKEIAGILSVLVEGRAGDSEMERLEQLLSNDEKAQAYYLQYLSVHTDLERLSERVDTRKTIPSARRWRIAILATAACALIGVCIGFWIAPVKDESRKLSDAGKESPLIQKNVIAVVGSTKNAVWSIEEQDPKPGLKLGTGEIRLESGLLRLDFHAGERVTLEGPSIFELTGINRLSLKSGNLVASVTPQGRGFTVIIPNGAVIDLGTKFAVKVEPNGENHVRVIEGAVMASSTNDQGHTSWEETLVEGDEFSIIKDAPLKKVRWSGESLLPLESRIEPLTLSQSYADEVLASKPIGYWRFDLIDGTGSVASETGETGGIALNLHGMADVEMSGSGGFLKPEVEGERGFAASAEAFSGLNTPQGCSMEFWAYSDSLEWQTLAGLMLDGPRPPNLLPKSALHNPHFLLVERASASGSKQHHVHPNFAMRAVLRSPAGYLGGVNVYSDQAYLIHGWHHIVVVRGNGRCRIYVDGELSGESDAPSAFYEGRYNLIIGRLHPLKDDLDSRPWSGGIDEVALYDHALEADEIRRHFQSSGRETAK